MSLSREQSRIVRTTFASVIQIQEAAADLFYGRLFELAPEVVPLFEAADMSVQGKKLMQMIGTAVSNLNNLNAFTPQIKELGARHVHYGVLDQHYDVVGEALLWALDQGLGSAFTPQVRDAWAAAYTVLAQVAIEGAEEERERFETRDVSEFMDEVMDTV